ncbi:chromate resistance protein, putative [Babesia ovata]|uniref:Chromate resistance protein, putative n=1 Tax=Babesia ovata TaxID=189622 RepID=A0A2H6K9P7_9APIC|nr:chromate resistance protein, putative [Babesia ovata]GBE59716.1 chromate resistance protein, putative [Babesia ovata]
MSLVRSFSMLFFIATSCRFEDTHGIIQVASQVGELVPDRSNGVRGTLRCVEVEHLAGVVQADVAEPALYEVYNVLFRVVPCVEFAGADGLDEEVDGHVCVDLRDIVQDLAEHHSLNLRVVIRQLVEEFDFQGVGHLPLGLDVRGTRGCRRSCTLWFLSFSKQRQHLLAELQGHVAAALHELVQPFRIVVGHGKDVLHGERVVQRLPGGDAVVAQQCGHPLVHFVRCSGHRSDQLAGVRAVLVVVRDGKNREDSLRAHVLHVLRSDFLLRVEEVQVGDHEDDGQLLVEDGEPLEQLFLLLAQDGNRSLEGFGDVIANTQGVQVLNGVEGLLPQRHVAGSYQLVDARLNVQLWLEHAFHLRLVLHLHQEGVVRTEHLAQSLELGESFILLAELDGFAGSVMVDLFELGRCTHNIQDHFVSFPQEPEDTVQRPGGGIADFQLKREYHDLLRGFAVLSVETCTKFGLFQILGLGLVSRDLRLYAPEPLLGVVEEFNDDLAERGDISVLGDEAVLVKPIPRHAELVLRNTQGNILQHDLLLYHVPSLNPEGAVPDGRVENLQRLVILADGAKLGRPLEGVLRLLKVMHLAILKGPLGSC